MLFRSTGKESVPFAPSVVKYEYVATYSTTVRIIVKVELRGKQFDAVLDTGSPFTVCSPAVAQILTFDPADADEALRIDTWRGSFSGGLYREALHLLADEGDNLQLDATLFVPHPDQYADDNYEGPPLFLGLRNCLDAMRFAVDPFEELFYFGSRTI